MIAAALPLTISEAEFQRAVIDVALLYGWRCSHFRPAQVRPGRWATSLTGHPGWPDLALARRGALIVAELKTQHGRLTPEQRIWQEHLGGFGRIWRPADFPLIVAELRDGPVAEWLPAPTEKTQR